MEKIKLYTSKNCPNCVAVKAALEEDGLAFEELNMMIPETYADLEKECVERGSHAKSFRTAPVLCIEKCDIMWEGEDCLIAIEEREWEE